MNQSILDKIRKVEPYVPGEQPKERVIKLNTNENPYPPAPGVAKVLKEMDADSPLLYIILNFSLNSFPSIIFPI